MPLPKPRKNEPTRHFISRCIAFSVGEGTPGNQAAAMCYSQARRAGRSVPKPPKKEESVESFLKRLDEWGQPDELDDRLVNERFMTEDYASRDVVAASSLDDLEEEIMSIKPPKSYSQELEEQEKLSQP